MKIYRISKEVELPAYFGTNLFECKDDCPLAFKYERIFEFFGSACPFQEIWNICPFRENDGWKCEVIKEESTNEENNSNT